MSVKNGGHSEKQDFYRGQHQNVLAKMNISSQSNELHVAAVGTLTFEGRFEDAIDYYRNVRSVLEPSAIIECRLYIVISLCRLGKYHLAHKHVIKALREAYKLRTHRELHFAHQAAGFLRFFNGRFKQSLSHARKSFTHAQQSEFDFGRAISGELLAHSFIQTGKVSTGLRSLELAIKDAKKIPNSKLSTSFQISQITYRAQAGIDPNGSVEALRTLIVNENDAFSYSKTNAVLELARQLCLRGDVGSAKSQLDSICPVIYASGHRRQSLVLSMRYAWASLLRGQHAEALHLVNSGKRLIDVTVDAPLELELLGLEQKVLSEIGTMVSPEVTKKIEVLTRKTAKGTGNRIVGRAGEVQTHPIFPGEDPLGDLLDMIKRNPSEAFSLVVQNGYYGLLYDVFGLSRNQKTLLIKHFPFQIMTFDHGNVNWVSDGVTNLMIRFLIELSKGQRSKEKLISSIWGYKYHPLQHDPLIYRLVARTRAILGSAGSWIVAIDDGYHLAESVSIVHEDEERKWEDSVATVDDTDEADEPQVSGLNYRQMDILRHLKVAESALTVPECSELFQVSEATARRDLSDLVKQLKLQRIGKGRAVRYKPVKRVSSNREKSL
jgi:hypothetical protein